MKRLAMRSMGVVAITTFALGACSSLGSPAGTPTPTLGPGALPSTASTAGPTPIASEPAHGLGVHWEWAPIDTRLQAATAGGPGWVLVGSDAPIQDPTSMFYVPAAWTSADGRTWARSKVALPSGASFGEFTVVARGPDGLVAAGTVDLTTGTVWGSADGRAWEVFATGSLFDLGPCIEGCARMTSIAAGPAGIVVSGYRVPSAGADVWVSDDASDWRRVTLPAPADSDVQVAAETSVTATSGGFLAVGRVCRFGMTSCRAVTWASTDGIDWHGPTDLPGGTDAGALRAVVGGDRTVILGQHCADGCRYTAWSSTDGSTWTLGDLLSGDVASHESGLLTFAGDRFLVMGSGDMAIEVWSSADGLAWQREPVEPGPFVATPRLLIVDLAGRADAALAAGVRSADTREQPGVWTSP